MTTPHQSVLPLLRSRHPWQIAYVTNDTPRAVEVFGQLNSCPDFYVRDPNEMQVSTPSGPRTMEVQVSFAYLGDLCIEFIEPRGGDARFYSDPLPADGFGLVHHHFGYVLDGTIEEWEAFRSRVSDDQVLFESDKAAERRYLYLDTLADLGHYLEYLWFEPEFGRQWELTIPRN